MLLFDKYTRTDNTRYKSIYLEQEPVPNRRQYRWRCLPFQDGMAVLVTALTEEHARQFYEREFEEPVTKMEIV